MQSKIMFIDDEPGVLEALELIFADEPYDCQTCRKPEQAMRLMEESDFAVVVSDHRMEGIEGAEFLKRINNQWPSTIRILMTAYQEMNVVMDAINKGHVYNLIFKPWDEMELKLVIKNAVDDYNLRNIRASCGSIEAPLDINIRELQEINHSLERKNKHLMDRLQQAQKMEALGNLAGGIAHDFNNILFIINGCLAMARADSSLSPDMETTLSQALQASRRASDLVSQILTFCKSGDESGKPLQLGALTKEIITFIQAALPSGVELRENIRVTFEKARIDSIKVYQILINLCKNAAEAMNRQSGTIIIELARTRIDYPEMTGQMKLSPGSYFRLTVSDNGSGIDTDSLKRIFDPYYTTKGLHGGTGLGLALVRQIVQEHGGRITVQSKIGEGTDFHVYLPLVDDSISQLLYDN